MYTVLTMYKEMGISATNLVFPQAIDHRTAFDGLLAENKTLQVWIIVCRSIHIMNWNYFKLQPWFHILKEVQNIAFSLGYIFYQFMQYFFFGIKGEKSISTTYLDL